MLWTRPVCRLSKTETGWYLVRAIAMVFDAYLQTDLDRARFSKII